MRVAKTIEWTERGVVMLDQRQLPGKEGHQTDTDYGDGALAIKEMVIRGAPAIGVAAAMGAALGVARSRATTVEALKAEFAESCDTLAKTRPTAVDLFWAIGRMKKRFARAAADGTSLEGIRQAMIAEAQEIHVEKRATDEAMGRLGAELMPQTGQVMTQGNAGALATAGLVSRPGVTLKTVE